MFSDFSPDLSLHSGLALLPMLEFQDHTECIDLSGFPFNFDTLHEIQDVKPRTERERENREEEGREPSSVELEPLTISGSLVKISGSDGRCRDVAVVATELRAMAAAAV